MIKECKEIKEQIADICEAILIQKRKGATPQEIAHNFGGKGWLVDDDPEYLYYNIDFEHFGITFVAEKEKPDEWWWENYDEIWMFDTQEWEYWKSF